MTLPGNQRVTASTTVPISGVGVEDLDAQEQPVALSLSARALCLGPASFGLSFTSGGNGQSTMTAAATLADLNAALAGLSDTAHPGSSGTDTLLATLSDQGNSGTGGAETDSGSLAITIRPSSQVTPVFSIQSVEIGSADGGTGVIADVRLYDRVLSQAQITALQSSGAALYEIRQTVDSIDDLANRRIGKEVDYDGDGMVDHWERYVWDVASPDGKGNVVLVSTLVGVRFLGALHS